MKRTRQRRPFGELLFEVLRSKTHGRRGNKTVRNNNNAALGELMPL